MGRFTRFMFGKNETNQLQVSEFNFLLISFSQPTLMIYLLEETSDLSYEVLLTSIHYPGTHPVLYLVT
jgi:hypothetical protein